MSRRERLSQHLQQVFQPQHIDILDESHMHAGPAAETHFKLTLVSNAFNGLSRVRRHQLVYAETADEMASGLHALALHLYTANEWQALLDNQQSVPGSPNCRGGDASSERSQGNN